MADPTNPSRLEQFRATLARRCKPRYPAADAADMTGFHASEVPFVFGTIHATPSFWPAITDTVAERRFSNQMLDYWTGFARNGTPFSADGPAWRPFGSEAAYMHFGEVPSASIGFMPGMYALHEQVMCRRRAEGSQSWNWRTGGIAPILPGPNSDCSS